MRLPYEKLANLTAHSVLGMCETHHINSEGTRVWNHAVGQQVGAIGSSWDDETWVAQGQSGEFVESSEFDRLVVRDCVVD